MSTIILNVSGIKVETYKSTLKKCEYFKNKLERWDEKTLIDQDYKTFIHFLNLLRNDDYVIPKKYVDNVIILAKFYGCPLKGVETPESVRSFVSYKYFFQSNVSISNTISFGRSFNFTEITSFCFKIDNDAELFIKGFEIRFAEKIYDFGYTFFSYFIKSLERDIFVYTSTKSFIKIFNELLESSDIFRKSDIKCVIHLENMNGRNSSYIVGNPDLKLYVSGWE